MHELSIMQSALECVLEGAEKARARRVIAVRLRVGVLSGVAPEALEFAFEALTPGTLAEGAELGIEHVPARFWCEGCDLEFQADDMLSECPKCHQFGAGLRSGQEMELASIEIEGRAKGTTQITQREN